MCALVHTGGGRERLTPGTSDDISGSEVPLWDAISSQFSSGVCTWPPAPSLFLSLEVSKQLLHLGASQHCQEALL